MRRLLLRTLAVLLLLVIVAATGGYWYERPLLLTGSGYAAHSGCALRHVAGRTSTGDIDLPPNPLVPYLRTNVTDDSARTTVLGALAGQKAWYTTGFGCTLAATKPDPGAATAVTAGADLPIGSRPAALDAALATAFGDDLDAAGRTRLGTRAVVVLKDGRLIAERYAPGFDATTPQLGWSMSKSVTSLLTGVLVKEETVTPTTDHLRPEWTDDRAKITIDHLLRMTSGLTWDETYDLGTPITRMLYLEPDMGRYVASLPAAHSPGSYQLYSSGSTTLLCSVLATRTGAGADLPRRRLFAPLGLSSAVWEPDAAGTPVCSSYLWATPRDWARIGQFALQDGVWNGTRLLPEGWMTRTTTPDLVGVATTEERGYAAGWWTNRDVAAGASVTASTPKVRPALPADAYWAQGHDGQRLIVVPSARLVVVRLGFSPGVEADELRTDDVVRAAIG